MFPVPRMIRIEIDLDGIPPATRPSDVGLLVPPPYSRPTPHGLHAAYLIDGLPEWVEQPVEEDGPDAWRHRARQREVLTLLRDLIGAEAAGFDQRAPVSGLREHGPYLRNADVDELVGIDDLLVRVDPCGKRAERAAPPPEVVDLLDALGYTPGARYTRDKCWRHDHVTGGYGKGTCVTVFNDGSGLYCWGGHAEEGGGPAYISTASLLAMHGLLGDVPVARDESLLPALAWVAAHPNYVDAVHGLSAIFAARGETVEPGRVRQLAAAVRLRPLLSDSVPRPTPRRDPFSQLVWDAGTAMLAQFLPESGRLDHSIHKQSRAHELAQTYPSLLYRGEPKRKRGRPKKETTDAATAADDEGAGDGEEGAAEGTGPDGVGVPVAGDQGAQGGNPVPGADGGSADGTAAADPAGRPDLVDDGLAWIASPHATALLAHDAGFVARHGILRVRTVAAPRYLAPSTEWIVEGGLPVELRMPQGWKARRAVSREESLSGMLELLQRVPVPEGMDPSDADVLRLVWLLPALTETYPGALPLVYFAGGTGAGKGRTVQAIQSAWRYHYGGKINVGDPREVDNALVAGRAGAVWLLDEFTTAVDKRVLAHLKAIMTHESHNVRLFNTQRFADMRMNHAWFTTSRMLTGPMGRDLETDWRRRIVPVQFPQQAADRGYVGRCAEFVEWFDPLRVMQWLGKLLEGVTARTVREDWSRHWPDALPGWWLLVGLAREYLGVRIDAAKQAARVRVDQSALDIFHQWWLDGDAPERADVRRRCMARAVQSFGAIKRWLGLRRERELSDLARQQVFANALLTQLGSESLAMPEAHGLPAGYVRLYNSSGEIRWRWTPAESSSTPPTNGNGHRARERETLLPVREAVAAAPIAAPAGSNLFEGFQRFASAVVAAPAAAPAVAAPADDTFAAFRRFSVASAGPSATVEAPAPVEVAPVVEPAGEPGDLFAAFARFKGVSDGPASSTASPAEVPGGRVAVSARPEDEPGDARPADADGRRPRARGKSRRDERAPRHAVEAGGGADERTDDAVGTSDVGGADGEFGGSDGADDPTDQGSAGAEAASGAGECGGAEEGGGESAPEDGGSESGGEAQETAPGAGVMPARDPREGFEPGVEIMPVVMLDFESFHPDKGALKKERAPRYWEHFKAQSNCMVAFWWTPGKENPDYGRACVVVWTRGPVQIEPRIGLASRDLFAPGADAHLQRFSDKPPLVTFHHGPECPPPLLAAVAAGVPFAAHNAQFDARAWRRMGWPEPSAWYDTMHLARAALGTGALDEALTRVYGTGKVDKPNEWVRWEILSLPMRQSLVRYCASDTIPAASLLLDLSARLQPWELAHSAVDFRMNDRGLPVDRALAGGIALVAKDLEVDAAANATQIVQALDGPEASINLNSPAQVVKWCAAHGLLLVDATQRTLEAVLDEEERPEWYRWFDGSEPIPRWFRKKPEGADESSWADWPAPHPVAKLPDDNGRTIRAILGVLGERAGSVSIAKGKAQAALRELCLDGRLRDQIQHRKAHTGRAAGQGVQPQNLPRGVSKVGPDAEPGADLAAGLDELRGVLREIGNLQIPLDDSEATA